jgi:hypothetical protein
MRTPSFRRNATALLLISILAAPLASAAALRNEIAGPARAVSLSPMELLDHLWIFLRAVWSKEGCNIDPDGHCKPGTTSQPTARTKDGCNIDPDGRCKPGTTSQPTARTKDGCHLDPDGRCRP